MPGPCSAELDVDNHCSHGGSTLQAANSPLGTEAPSTPTTLSLTSPLASVGVLVSTSSQDSPSTLPAPLPTPRSSVAQPPLSMTPSPAPTTPQSPPPSPRTPNVVSDPYARALIETRDLPVHVRNVKRGDVLKELLQRKARRLPIAVAEGIQCICDDPSNSLDVQKRRIFEMTKS